MAILVVAEHDNVNVKDATHKTVTAALAMGGDVDVLVAGKGVKDVAAEAAKISGVRKVLACDHVSLKKQLAEAMQEVIVPLMADYDAVLAPDVRASDLCGQCHGNSQIIRRQKGRHRPSDII